MIESLLIFVIGNNEFAIDLKYSPLVVKAIKVLQDSEDKLEIIEEKFKVGKFLKLVDLKKFLGFGKTNVSETSRLLIFESQNFVVGLLVDEVKYVMSLDETSSERMHDLDDEELIYKTYSMENKKVNIINIEMIPELNNKLQNLELLNDSSISIGTIEDTESEKNLNDLVAMSVSIKEDNEPVVIKVDRKGKLTQI
jgi:chemotaxis signal transduction protein